MDEYEPPNVQKIVDNDDQKVCCRKVFTIVECKSLRKHFGHNSIILLKLSQRHATHAPRVAILNILYLIS